MALTRAFFDDISPGLADSCFDNLLSSDVDSVEVLAFLTQEELEGLGATTFKARAIKAKAQRLLQGETGKENTAMQDPAHACDSRAYRLSFLRTFFCS